jgi:hypothetical protein
MKADRAPKIILADPDAHAALDSLMLVQLIGTRSSKVSTLRATR